jgi:hypothetical protein
VMNHYGTNDFWALMAHYFIPGSGPSGRVGFNGGMAAINVVAQGLGHSDFFDKNHLNTLFEKYWRPFLTLPQNELAGLNEPDSNRRVWREAWWLLRATFPRLILVGICVATAFLVLLSVGLGLLQILKVLVRQ